PATMVFTPSRKSLAKSSAAVPRCSTALRNSSTGRRRVAPAMTTLLSPSRFAASLSVPTKPGESLSGPVTPRASITFMRYFPESPGGDGRTEDDVVSRADRDVGALGPPPVHSAIAARPHGDRLTPGRGPARHVGKPPELRLLGFTVESAAERGGFEPPVPRGHTRFRVVPFQPGSRTSPERSCVAQDGGGSHPPLQMRREVSGPGSAGRGRNPAARHGSPRRGRRHGPQSDGSGAARPRDRPPSRRHRP